VELRKVLEIMTGVFWVVGTAAEAWDALESAKLSRIRRKLDELELQKRRTESANVSRAEQGRDDTVSSETGRPVGET
jgi:hypothetical protein